MYSKSIFWQKAKLVGWSGSTASAGINIVFRLRKFVLH
jgi:hypothetical protein